MTEDQSMFRQALVAELKRRGMTPYRLSKLQQVVHPHVARRYFYKGGGDARVRTIEALMKELDLVVVPRREVDLLRHARRIVKKAAQGNIVGAEKVLDLFERSEASA